MITYTYVQRERKTFPLFILFEFFYIKKKEEKTFNMQTIYISFPPLSLPSFSYFILRALLRDPRIL